MKIKITKKYITITSNFIEFKVSLDDGEKQISIETMIEDYEENGEVFDHLDYIASCCDGPITYNSTIFTIEDDFFIISKYDMYNLNLVSKYIYKQRNNTKKELYTEFGAEAKYIIENKGNHYMYEVSLDQTDICKALIETSTPIIKYKIPLYKINNIL